MPPTLHGGWSDAAGRWPSRSLLELELVVKEAWVGDEAAHSVCAGKRKETRCHGRSIGACFQRGKCFPAVDHSITREYQTPTSASMSPLHVRMPWTMPRAAMVRRWTGKRNWHGVSVSHVNRGIRAQHMQVLLPKGLVA
jgi:hypothetical protein